MKILSNTLKSMLALSFVLIVSSAAKPMLHDDDPVLVEITKKYLAQNNLPGANIVIITPDGKMHSASVGFENRYSENKLKHHNLMFAGSTGKVLFGAVALQLADEGVIDLDAPISTWLKDEDWFSRLPNNETITIRMLMNHTSGLINHVEHPDFLTDFKALIAESADNSITPREALEYLLDKEPLNEAGSAFAYSDTNYILMAYIVEKVTARSFYDLINERIIKPHDFKKMVAQKSRDIPMLATGHLLPTNLFGLESNTNMDEDGALLYNPSFEYAGGGYATNAKELAKLAQLLYVKKLISDERFDEMATTVDMFKRGAMRIGYGLGFMTWETPYGFAMGHSGYMPGYQSEMYYFKDDGVIVAMMVNQSQGYNATFMAFGIADEYMKAKGIREKSTEAR